MYKHAHGAQEDEQGKAHSTGWGNTLDRIYKVVLGEVNIVSGEWLCWGLLGGGEVVQTMMVPMPVAFSAFPRHVGFGQRQGS